MLFFLSRTPLFVSLLILTIGIVGCRVSEKSVKSEAGNQEEVVQNSDVVSIAPESQHQAEPPGAVSPRIVKYFFGSHDSRFRFTGLLPEGLAVSYVPGSQSISIYDPATPGDDDLEKSQIFIRFFEANTFLTLTTVDIHVREETTVHGHAAVKYDIEKKSGVANFPYQPAWRNEQHTVLDIRLASKGRTIFYVFAKNPALPQNVLDSFIDSLVFDSDERGFVNPLDGAIKERMTKKPFGIRVSPINSPVSPERFSGFHTGVDFETLEDEADTPIEVRSLCGGVIKVKRQADGYGGVVVQECLIGDQPVTVIYGHLSFESVAIDVGTYSAAGDTIGILGRGASNETDGERKHLHFGIHKGSAINIGGYVGSKSALTSWLDPADYLVE